MITLIVNEEVAHLFDASDSGIAVLLVTFHVGAYGLNLHHNCSRVVVAETPRNMNTLWQAAGRVHRLGQRHEQNVWTLRQALSIERYLDWNNTRKAIPQIAAMNMALNLQDNNTILARQLLELFKEEIEVTPAVRMSLRVGEEKKAITHYGNGFVEKRQTKLQPFADSDLIPHGMLVWRTYRLQEYRLDEVRGAIRESGSNIMSINPILSTAERTPYTIRD
ncbi:hypothetical protein P170DRAFT_481285 [Aspergillus steynii IBT 23096]|uniref:Helicase C-terminal domain-containing protein n=1 Tax=Aspergillus steynii IBT 23096 TaxID=1392250 RepID=A0A2I2FRU9_9EURO|nr:uncharacterized protein P170DRAFT_481285 [Aspergillus steynii IBT 23096]PLB43337.1 hypothetical protein P170DRAFT_481285 [Aspergillus steynii IBT 23096]